MEKVIRLNFPVILIFSIFFFIGVMVLASPLCYEGGDNYIHYMLANYSWQFPCLFLDHWGKPAYTILSSPFAQFGFKGSKFFNVILAVLTLYYTFLTASRLQLKQPWLSIIFVCMAPIYFIMFNTSLTEILFGFFVIYGVYTFLNGKFIASTIIISILPFVRSEGYFFILLFIYALVVKKKIAYIPLLFLGLLLFSLAGHFSCYHDILWVMHANPYHNDAVKIYGTGELLYYIKMYPYITGAPLSILILSGIFSVFWDFRHSKINFLFKNQTLILIIYPAIIYVGIHSWLFYSGKLSSVGEIRVMAAIMPLFSLIALKGWNFYSSLTGGGYRRIFFTAGIILFTIKGAFKIYDWGFKPSGTEEVVLEASDWLKKSPYVKNKVFCYNPLFYVVLNLNPYDKSKFEFGVHDVNTPESNMEIGDLIIWDAHLGPNEGNLPLDRLLNNVHYKLLHIFHPKVPFKVLGGYSYEIYIFERVKLNSLSSGPLTLKLYDYENFNNRSDTSQIIQKAHSGNHSFLLDNKKLFSDTYMPTVGELRNDGIIKIMVEGYVYPLVNPKENFTSLIISFERDTSYNYNSIGLENTDYKLNEWNLLSLSCFIPPEAKDNDVMKIYFYQPGKNPVYLDDFKIQGMLIK
jgi:hypothetical protein